MRARIGVAPRQKVKRELLLMLATCSASGEGGELRRAVDFYPRDRIAGARYPRVRITRIYVRISRH